MNNQRIDSPLISCEWLSLHGSDSNTVILDAGFFLPRQQRNAHAEYRQEHIPDALFFDINIVADPNSNLPHTLPGADHFAALVGNMGIGNDTRVIIYDNNAFFASARAWWMFRVFGHELVYVLDGGLKRWKQRGLPLEKKSPEPCTVNYTAHFQAHRVCSLEQMKQIQQHGSYQILDARSPDSFNGLRPLGDPGLRAGHIPGSINIPYRNLTHPDDHTLLGSNELRHLFNKHAIDPECPIVTTCGSGVSAAILALALYRTGLTEVPMYDGSWAEWGRQPDTPVANQSHPYHNSC